jgi:aspartate racemase
MPKHIGIVAVSAEGAALCYRTICVEGASVLGRHAHPEVTMHTYPLSEYMRHIDAGRWDKAGRLLLASAKKLAAAGADFLICPDNTLHQAIDEIRAESPLPWLHIAEVVAAEARRRGYRRLGVLGTRYLMEGPVYATKLAAHGLDYVIPEPECRRRINEVIFDELVYGRVEEAARSYFRGVIGQLKEQGCDAVVLGCTEIPLLISEADSPLPLLDSTRLLAREALQTATDEQASSPSLTSTLISRRRVRKARVAGRSASRRKKRSTMNRLLSRKTKAVALQDPIHLAPVLVTRRFRHLA